MYKYVRYGCIHDGLILLLCLCLDGNIVSSVSYRYYYFMLLHDVSVCVCVCHIVAHYIHIVYLNGFIQHEKVYYMYVRCCSTLCDDRRHMKTRVAI